ncbi:MAG: HAD family hydrolase [Candidatus Krumholzibacteriota bacterium]|nr:HAD family hydrolase [Candidatus Krumholzibacteriota bacterium]
MSRRAVFLDRDGTLVRDRHYLAAPQDLELYPDSIAALRLLRRTKLALVLVSNQSGVARGLFDEAAVAAVHARLARLLAGAGLSLDGIYYCPHHPEGRVGAYRRRCDCRKPAPGLLDRAARDLGLVLPGSWIVGDKADDLGLAPVRGLRAVLVRTGHGLATEAALGEDAPEHVADGILGAARWILEREVGA